MFTLHSPETYKHVPLWENNLTDFIKMKNLPSLHGELVLELPNGFMWVLTWIKYFLAVGDTCDEGRISKKAGWERFGVGVPALRQKGPWQRSMKKWHLEDGEGGDMGSLSELSERNASFDGILALA